MGQVAFVAGHALVTALCLAQFGTSAQFWTGLQSHYDLDVATDTLGDRIAREVQRCETAE